MQTSVGASKIYIASPFFNDYQLNKVKSLEEKLDRLGLEYFSPRLSNISPLYDKLKETEDDSDKSANIIKNVIFKENIDNIDACGIMIANIDGLDSGTLFEVGYAISKRKVVIPMDENSKNLSLLINTVMDSDELSYPKYYSVYDPVDYFHIITSEAYRDCKNDNSEDGRLYVISESWRGGVYTGLSKVMVGFLYGSYRPWDNNWNIYYIDIHRKSNLMLSCAVNVLEYDNSKDIMSENSTGLSKDDLVYLIKHSSPINNFEIDE